LSCVKCYRFSQTQPKKPPPLEDTVQESLNQAPLFEHCGSLHPAFTFHFTTGRTKPIAFILLICPLLYPVDVEFPQHPDNKPHRKSKPSKANAPSACHFTSGRSKPIAS
jgi:hypothetical protein